MMDRDKRRLRPRSVRQFLTTTSRDPQRSVPLPRSTAPDTPHSHPAHHAPETWSEWTGRIRRAAATTPAESSVDKLLVGSLPGRHITMDKSFPARPDG